MATDLPFDDKTLITTEVVKLVNTHWIRCKGELYNDKTFWDNTLHSLNNQDWEDMMTVMDVLYGIDQSLFNYDARSSFERVKEILMKEGHSGNPRALDARKHKKTEFKALMNIKDIMNEIAGYRAPTKFPKDDDKPRPFDGLFDIGDDNAS